MSSELEIATVVEGYRAICEDRVNSITLDQTTLILVADGVGGQHGGAEAAQALLDAVGESFPSISDPMNPLAWCEELRKVDRLLCSRANSGQTTAVVVAASTDRLAGASVGDSGAWLVNPSGFFDLTSRQQRKPFIGSGVAMPVPFFAEFNAETLLVATDGLLKYGRVQDIGRVCRLDSLKVIPAQLIDLVRLQSGALQDDVGIAVCRRYLNGG